MITPRFSCSQTTDSIIVSIYCPSVRASEVEIHVEETCLTVNINPYFLRLNFSHGVLENDESSAKYDPGSGYLIVTLSKEIKGQDFKDLDLLAKLLAPRPKELPQQLTIEVIGTKDTQSPTEDDLTEGMRTLSLNQKDIVEAAKNDWQILQEVPEPLSKLNLFIEKRYGFLDMYSGYFKHVAHTENDVNELGTDAETCSPDERRKKRIEHEDEKWDEEHYIADFADDESIQELLTWKHPHAIEIDLQYTEAENAMMLRLPRKEYLATVTQTHGLYLTLVTLLFSYAYDARSTQNDPNIESAWTISSLIPAFSALDPPPYHPVTNVTLAATLTSEFSSLELAETLIPSYRRSLSFPLYRSFAFAEACRLDVARFLSKGRRTVVRCLLEMKNILDHHDVYYVYSKIWVDDFCVWAQAYASDETFSALARGLHNLKMEKRSIGWDLDELESAVWQLQQRESDSDDN